MRKFDENGYDRNGFHFEDGRHIVTGEIYNQKGLSHVFYDEDGMNKFTGYDSNGFNLDGINKYTGTKYDRNGFDAEGIHKDTNTKYDKDGFDKFGRHEITGTLYNPQKINRRGFDIKGINVKTGTKYDKDGFNERGYDKNGYDINGFDKDGFNKDGINDLTETKYDPKGFDTDGFNKDGINRRGFDRKGIHSKTGTIYDEEGFVADNFTKLGHRRTRFNENGLDKYGLDKNKFDKDGNFFGHNKYDVRGYDANGFDEEGFNAEGYDAEGFDKEGINKDGFNRDGIYKTGSKFNEDGLDENGVIWHKSNEDIDDMLYPYAVEIVNYYLDSDYLSLSKMFEKENSITEERFKLLMDVISRKNPDLYEEIQNKMEEKRNKRFIKLVTGVDSTIKKIKSGVKTPKGEIRKYEYFDLLLDTHRDIGCFEENLRKLKKEGKAKPTRETYKFIEKCNKRDKHILNKENILRDKYSILIDGNQVDATEEQKQKVIDFCEIHSIPLEHSVYYSLLRNYMKGNIDLNDMTQEYESNIEENYDNTSNKRKK